MSKKDRFSINNDDNNIEKLKEITPQLPKFPQSISNPYNTCIEYKVLEGTCLAWDLLWIEDISVSKWFLSNGTKFPKHSHNEKEIIIVYKGHLEIYYEDGNEATLKSSNVIHHQPNTIHWAEAKKDTWMIIIMIPASYDYPGSPKVMGDEFHE